MKEWEINYEFHLGDGLVRGVDWDRTPSNGELPCDQCPRKFGWRYEIMFHSLCHMMDPDGNPKNKVCPECDTVFKVKKSFMIKKTRQNCINRSRHLLVMDRISKLGFWKWP